MLHIRNRMDAEREGGVVGWHWERESFCGKRISMHKRLNFHGVLCEIMTYFSEIWNVAWLLKLTELGGWWKMRDRDAERTGNSMMFECEQNKRKFN